MKVIKLVILVLWMMLIFCFSNQKSIDSTNISSGFIDKTIVKVYRIFNNNISREDEENIIDKYSYPVRKFAHYTLYFILGILVLLVLKDYDKFNNELILYSLLICFLYACSDEFHQLFIDGRSASFKDILLDTFGSLSSILLFFYIVIKKKVNPLKNG